MKLRLFVQNALNDNEQLELSREQTHYLKNVMRRKLSDQIYIFNGYDGEWLGEITELSNKHSAISLLEQSSEQQNSPDIWLLFAKIKRSPTELLIQKSTELGVSKLLPVFTQHSDSKPSNTERLRQISIEAAEQSERLDIPKVEEAVKLSEILNEWDETRKIIICDESGGGKAMNKVLANFDKDDKWAILIGPEGGFSISELETLKNLPYVIPVGLGPRILKAETAAITALTCWQFICGDFSQPPKFNNKE
jgi:16S rRNA (uracil1498-N3)-methyltransferase